MPCKEKLLNVAILRDVATKLIHKFVAYGVAPIQAVKEFMLESTEDILCGAVARCARTD